MRKWQRGAAWERTVLFEFIGEWTEPGDDLFVVERHEAYEDTASDRSASVYSPESRRRKGSVPAHNEGNIPTYHTPISDHLQKQQGNRKDSPHHSFRIQNLHLRISFQSNIPRFNISFSSASSVLSSSAICSGDL